MIFTMHKIYTLEGEQVEYLDVIKMIMHMSGTPFEHVHLTTELWTELKTTMPGLQLPMMKFTMIDTKETVTYMGSMSIVKMLAKRYYMTGDVSEDHYKIEQIIKHCTDLYEVMFDTHTTTKPLNIQNGKFMPKLTITTTDGILTKVKTILETIEKMLSERKTKFVYRDTLTIGDLFLMTVLGHVDKMFPEVVKKLPTMIKWKEMMLEHMHTITSTVTMKPETTVFYTVDTTVPDFTEVIKFIMHMKRIPFEHVHLTMEQWTEMKTKMPEFHLPMLRMFISETKDTTTYMGLMPIVKLLGKKYHLMGDTEEDYYKIEQVLLHCTDLYKVLMTSTTTKDMVISKVTKFLETVEKTMSESSGLYVTGDKLTVGDLFLMATMEYVHKMYPEIEKHTYRSVTVWKETMSKDVTCTKYGFTTSKSGIVYA